MWTRYQHTHARDFQNTQDFVIFNELLNLKFPFLSFLSHSHASLRCNKHGSLTYTNFEHSDRLTTRPCSPRLASTSCQRRPEQYVGPWASVLCYKPYVMSYRGITPPLHPHQARGRLVATPNSHLTVQMRACREVVSILLVNSLRTLTMRTCTTHAWSSSFSVPVPPGCCLGDKVKSTSTGAGCMRRPVFFSHIKSFHRAYRINLCVVGGLQDTTHSATHMWSCCLSLVSCGQTACCGICMMTAMFSSVLYPFIVQLVLDEEENYYTRTACRGLGFES